MAKNRFRLLRDSNSGRPRNKQVDVEKRLHDAGVDGHAGVGAQAEAGVAQAGDEFRERGVLTPVVGGGELFKGDAADDEAFVGRKPGIIVRREHHGLAIQRERWFGGQIFGRGHPFQQIAGGMLGVGG